MTDQFHAFVGTYTDGDSDGIYTCRLDTAAGTLEHVAVTDAGPNPSFLAIHPNGEYLYAVNEVDDGAVAALSIDRESGELAVLNRVVTGGGADPCYCTVDDTGQYLLVAHYTGGAIAVVPIRDDGRVGEPTQVIEHEGSGPNEDRQEAAHPHSIRPGPENRFVYVPDLGADEIVSYELDLDDGTLHPTDQGALELPAGAGPRHVDFHPNGTRMYLLNELDSTLFSIDYDPATGALAIIDSETTLPTTFEGESFSADVHVHDSGRFVYASNRGHDSIAVFKTDASTGELTPIQRVPTGGEWPRNFVLTPSETHLLAENKNTDDVVTFAIDDVAGRLDRTGDRFDVPSPTCLEFLPVV